VKLEFGDVMQDGTVRGGTRLYRDDPLMSLTKINIDIDVHQSSVRNQNLWHGRPGHDCIRSCSGPLHGRDARATVSVEPFTHGRAATFQDAPRVSTLWLSGLSLLSLARIESC